MTKLDRLPKVPDRLHKVPKILFQLAETSAFERSPTWGDQSWMDLQSEGSTFSVG